MLELLFFFSQLILSIIILFFILYFIYSILEKESQAVKRIIPIILFLILLFILNVFKIMPDWIILMGTFVFVFGFFLFLSSFGNKEIIYSLPKNSFDERDIMFSRMELEEGTKKFDHYYQRKKENKSKDDLFRKEPGLLSPDSKFYHPLLYSAASATFSTVDLLQPLVEKEYSKNKLSDIDISEISDFIKSWTKKLGAMDVGFTLVKSHHVYSHVGRGENYGKEVQLSHKYAIAFTVEMNHESLNYTPKGPIIMESAQQYLNAGTIAVQVAQFIRNMGFDARAHIDANYRIICPIVAMDAGLGTIGRMGLLMTPKLGPRVRVGVVTTDLNLDICEKPMDSTVVQFCEICKKCAYNCPSTAISSLPGENENVREPWKINHEKCFTYWCKAGTDCGRCVTVCPYSHPDNFIHNIIRWSIKRNPVNRWLALKLDNYFYGRKPSILSLKSWSIFSRS